MADDEVVCGCHGLTDRQCKERRNGERTKRMDHVVFGEEDVPEVRGGDLTRKDCGKTNVVDGVDEN